MIPNLTALGTSSLVELVIGYDLSCQVHFHIFGWISLEPLGSIALPMHAYANETNSDGRS